MLGLAVPQFGSLFTAAPETEFKRLARLIKSLRTDAILQNRQYVVVFDRLQQQVRIEEEQNGERIVFDEDARDRMLRPHPLPAGWEIADIQFSETDNSDLSVPPEKAEIYINNSGFVTPFRFQFHRRDEPDQVWEIATKGILGQLELRSPTNEV
jgi:hypothetical protein